MYNSDPNKNVFFSTNEPLFTVKKLHTHMILPLFAKTRIQFLETNAMKSWIGSSTFLKRWIVTSYESCNFREEALHITKLFHEISFILWNE
jgi:hypothetical protein